MSIIGENFDPNLIKQIETRQDKLGQTSLAPADIVYNNSRTAWLRMASGIDLKDASTAGLGNINPSGLAGNKLAANFVLYGGISSESEGNPASSVFPKNSAVSSQIKSQYGVGFSTDWGPVPPPGIESMEIQAINRGGLRKAQILLTAHNPDQFKLIETLYLRLGFTMLLEWGHTHYYDNGGNLKEMNYTTDPLTSFLGASGGGYKKYRGIQDQIDETRQKTNYNYDGFVGFVQNFNWSFTENGTYQINLTVISSGALIESLTVNKGLSSEHADKVGYSVNGDVFSSYVDHWRRSLNDSIIMESLPQADFFNAFNLGFKVYRENQEGKRTLLTGNQVSEQANLALSFDVTHECEVIKMGMIDPSSEINKEADQYYVSLGFFLRFLEATGLYYDSNNEAIFGIQHEYGKSFMLTHPFQNSVDPTVCILDSETVMLDGHLTDGSLLSDLNSRESTGEIIKVPKATELYTSLFRQGSEGNKKFQGDIMGVMVNMNHIINTINSTKSEDGTTTCHAVLSAILNDIERVTGNINNFVIGYNEKTRKIIIYDENTVPGITDKGKTGKINLYGFEAGNTQGNFVKNFSFNTKVFPNITNLIAVSAQSEIPLPDKASSYQVLNRNLTDRLMSGMDASPYKSKTSNNQASSDNYLKLIANLSNHFRVLYNERQFRSEGTTNVNYETALRETLLYDLQFRVKLKEIPSPFFIPVGLSVTLDGLSGMTKYQKFDVGPDYILPPEYPNNLDFIIQEVNHSVKGNEWTTTVDTLSWPKHSTSSGGKGISDEVFSGLISKVAGEAQGLTEFPIIEGAIADPIFVANSNTLFENFGITRGTVLSQDKLLKTFHPDVRDRFGAFFTRMKNNPKLKGYTITINSALRTFPQQHNLYTQRQTTVEAGDSRHNYGVAIDLALVHPTLSVVCGKTTDIDIWRQSGVPTDMQFTGVNFWKGDHEDDGYIDRVHFHVNLNTAAAKERAREYYYDISNLGVDQIFNLDISDLI